MTTTKLFLTDAYRTDADACVTGVTDDENGRRVSLDETIFYATSGGQQHDTGRIGDLAVTDVAERDGIIWHTVSEGSLPALGDRVTMSIDWPRRHANMRTHTAMHILCGVIWNEYGVQVTGGNMEPLSGRMDFNFDPLPPGFKESVEAAINAEIERDRAISVSFLSRGDAVLDHDLVRTATSRVPDVDEIRIVDIDGLDRQADGGTHVRSTAEVGRVQITKVENKGKANKRVRLQVLDRD